MSDYMKELERLIDALIFAHPHEVEKWRERLLAHAAQADRAVSGVPDGWKLVPVEPTPEMLGAGLRHVEGMASMPSAYRAMLAAAPPPPTQAGRDVPVELPEPDTHCYDTDEERDVWSHSPDQMRTYGDAREAAGYAAGVTSGAKQMFDYIQFAAANTSDTEWDTRLCELSQDALAAVSPAAHTEWKTIQRVASESRAAGEAAGYARGRAEKQSKAPEQCRWFQAGPDSDTWQTGCGSYFTINDGTPSENNMAHCAYCGRHLVEYSWEEEQKGGK